jgi:uncharacterized protein (DUF302 family)
MRSVFLGTRSFAICLALLSGAGIFAPALAQDRIDVISWQSFDETVERLQWSIGGHGLTVVSAMKYHEILGRRKDSTPRAVVFEVMRRDWAQRLLGADVASGIVLPVRLYAFENASDSTVVSYFRPSALLDGAENETLRMLARHLDETIGAIVRESTSKSP